MHKRLCNNEKLKKQMHNIHQSSLERLWCKTNKIAFIIFIVVLCISLLFSTYIHAAEFNTTYTPFNFSEGQYITNTEAAVNYIMDSYGCHDESIKKAILKHSYRNGLDPVLIAAQIGAESEFNKKAVSKANCRGLMQLSADKLADYTDVDKNIAIGCNYDKEQLNSFGSIVLMLAGYNAGPYKVVKYGGVPPYKETQEYVVKIPAIANKARLYSSFTTTIENNPLKRVYIYFKNILKGDISNGKANTGIINYWYDERKQQLQKQQKEQHTSSFTSAIQNLARYDNGNRRKTAKEV